MTFLRHEFAGIFPKMFEFVFTFQGYRPGTLSALVSCLVLLRCECVWCGVCVDGADDRRLQYQDVPIPGLSALCGSQTFSVTINRPLDL